MDAEGESRKSRSSHTSMALGSIDEEVAGRLVRSPLFLGLPGLPAVAQPAGIVADHNRVHAAKLTSSRSRRRCPRHRPGDLIRVWPGKYVRRVVVDKPFILLSEPDPVEALDASTPAA
jgi:hypothetical protein